MKTQVRRITYAIRAPMPVAKRHFVTRQDILAMAIMLAEARAAALRPNYPLRAAASVSFPRPAMTKRQRRQG
jgi:hypothetical protein